MMAIHKTAYALVIVGALNWGLVGLFDFNLVSAIFGMWPMIEKLVYILVGISALNELMMHGNCCKECSVGMKTVGVPMVAKKKKRRK